MNERIELILATVDDAELLHQIKYEAFLPLYEKYHDDETNPAKEKIDKVIYQLTHFNGEYYKIIIEGQTVGAVRVARKKSKKENETDYIQDVNYISPLFIIPEFQNRGIGQIVIRNLFRMYENTITWRLDTIKQESGNCHLYEKCGFVRIGEEHIVNDRMTMINYEKANVFV